MKRLQIVRIGQVIGTGFGIILCLALLTGLLGRIAYDVSVWQRETIKTRSTVDRLTLELELISIRRTDALRRYLDSGDVTLLASYQTFQLAYADISSRLEDVIHTSEELNALDAVKQTEETFSDKEREILHLYQDGFDESARFLWDTEGVKAQDELLKTIERLRLAQGNTSAAILRQAEKQEGLVVNAVTVFVPLMLIGGLVIGYIITQKITNPLSDLIRHVDRIGTDLTRRVNPAGPKEIAFLGETINGMAQNLFSSRQSLQEYKDRLEQELQLASQIQASFLPTQLPQSPRLELAVYWQPAREVAGDFYAYIELDDGKRGIAIGDVSGKGAPAAMTGTLAEGLLEVYAPFHIRPETLLDTLNKDLATRLAPNHMNVACCYAILDDHLSQLTVANAGLIYPYLRRNNHIEELEIGGLPLGSTKDYQYQSISVNLEPDDLVIFSSDGLVEAMNEKSEMFGFDRLQAELLRLPSGVPADVAIQQLVQGVMEFTNQRDLQDDLTILVARVRA
ncbi:MAG: SpoIIE family protein phosphatase [Anaerolineae bacterium]|nr:SpoIIE family protein phosphatase [Anaerolineae bacterium]